MGMGKVKTAHSRMNNKEIRKIQFGGWQRRSYRQIRQLIKRRLRKELNLKLK